MLDAPTCYEDAISRDDAKEKKQAMDFEINSIESNDTFEVTELLEDKQLFGGNGSIPLKAMPKIVLTKLAM